ncbi:hypothetical protein [Chondrinema litorale]|uniref:hypothetical protein n=1 Tax=Chondrinema litorale TaxID=2994555 RepID=UPI00254271D8|nr:hypothetical protein [Chondrinema litorale]UZR97068.1 hypothetical protein OQ292_23500 [Chondrinema litorale]
MLIQFILIAAIILIVAFLTVNFLKSSRSQANHAEIDMQVLIAKFYNQNNFFRSMAKENTLLEFLLLKLNSVHSNTDYNNIKPYVFELSTRLMPSYQSMINDYRNLNYSHEGIQNYKAVYQQIVDDNRNNDEVLQYIGSISQELFDKLAFDAHTLNKSELSQQIIKDSASIHVAQQELEYEKCF